MRTRELGRSGLKVTEICLGTMTWGSAQNSEADAFAQLDYAMERGVTFWDTAELYPVNPTDAATYTLTEQYIGNWLQARGQRDKLVLATKIAGPGRPHIRGGSAISPDSIEKALEGSLKRLKTDYVDLYQLHWPNRGSSHFGQNWTYTPQGDTERVMADMQDTLVALNKAVKAGKIRHIGLSNETAWGTMQFLKLAEAHGLARMATIQNEYSLMNRQFEPDLLEVCVREGVGLLPYSPLATGWLTGKYYGGTRPDATRFRMDAYQGSQRLTPQAQKAADAYVDVARKHGLDPAQMAIAFTLSKPFVVSTIIGATKVDQLKADIDAAEVTLSAEVLADLAAVRRDWPMPY